MVTNAANDRANNSEEAMLRLSDDIGKMADRIGEMAERIGDMADRIVTTQEIQSKNMHETQRSILQAIEANNRLLEKLADKVG